MVFIRLGAFLSHYYCKMVFWAQIWGFRVQNQVITQKHEFSEPCSNVIMNQHKISFRTVYNDLDLF